MAYQKTVWATGDIITAELANKWESGIQDIHIEAEDSLADIFASGFVVTGMVASKNATTATELDVTAGACYVKQADGSLRRFKPAATSFTTSVASTTYYLDFNPDGTWSWGTAHSAQANYLPIAKVTTGSTGAIATVTDTRPLVPAAGKINADVVRGVDVAGKFDATTGHKHSGAAGDAPKLPLTSLDTDVATQAELDAHASATIAGGAHGGLPAHAPTHASGGSDALTPADIGAVANAGATPSVMAGLDANKPAAGVAGRIYIATDTKRIYRDNGAAWAQLPIDLPLGATIGGNTAWHAGNDGAGSGLDSDLLDGAHKVDITKLSAMAVVKLVGSTSLGTSTASAVNIQAGAAVHRFYIVSAYGTIASDCVAHGTRRDWAGVNVTGVFVGRNSSASYYEQLFISNGNAAYSTTLYYKVYQFVE